jgi:hypothetical protein
MPKGMQAIYTRVLSSSVSSITFNNIPQTYTDLKIVTSVRCDFAAVRLAGAIRFNGDASSLYSDTIVSGDGASASSGRSQTTFGYTSETTGTTATANVFANNDIYIPNYTSTMFKQYLSDSSSEHIGNQGNFLYAGLYRANSRITSITLFPGGGANFIANSKFTLYGIGK